MFSLSTIYGKPAPGQPIRPQPTRPPNPPKYPESTLNTRIGKDGFFRLAPLGPFNSLRNVGRVGLALLRGNDVLAKLGRFPRRDVIAGRVSV
jgi:hypothetical protein